MLVFELIRAKFNRSFFSTNCEIDEILKNSLTIILVLRMVY
jgi:hypothetical protein